MKSQLVVSVLGSDRPGIVSELCKIATDSGCNIENSRMASLGTEFAVIMLLSGKWDAIAKFENHIPNLEKKGLTLQSKRTEESSKVPNTLRYDISIISMDDPGLVHKISEFFTSHHINIDDLHTGTYAASHTGTPMFCLDMSVNIDHKTKIAELREQFILLCDELNVDVAMEPSKL